MYLGSAVNGRPVTAKTAEVPTALLNDNLIGFLNCRLDAPPRVWIRGERGVRQDRRRHPRAVSGGGGARAGRPITRAIL